CVSAGIGIYSFEGQYVFFIVLFEALGAFATVAVSMLLLTRTRAARFLTLETRQRPEDGYTNTPNEDALVGQAGTVLTALRPAGTIVLDGRRLDAVAQGTFIEKYAPVRVVAVHGNRIVVERADS
ncbi:MAG TPA: NfeD family protein, partial [Candidatus Hydrogenedentes bacterium]|nr:NfeD family protein [Candidatus Hydrogenedentota bacterium]